ncbi:MAG: nuclear transport factor 2 family protein [Pseudomonadota bacterium]
MRVALLSALIFAMPIAAAAAESLDSIEARLDAAEGIRAAKRLQNAYGHYLEAGQWNDVAALFTQDATAEFPDGKAQGTAAIKELFMQRAGRSAPGLAPGQLNAHLQLQPIVNATADGGTILATYHEFWMQGEFGKGASSGGGVYENEYRRENGVWAHQQAALLPAVRRRLRHLWPPGAGQVEYPVSLRGEARGRGTAGELRLRRAEELRHREWREGQGGGLRLRRSRAPRADRGPHQPPAG